MKYYFVALLLTFFSTVKVVADVFGFQSVSAVAAVSNVAPAMKVFTAHKGYETYSSKFELSVTFADEKVVTIILTPENYAGLRGPYNRRNVYGALIAYGPVLVNNPVTLPMWREMTSRTFCNNNNLISELGINSDSAVRQASIRYLGQVKEESDYPDELKVSCDV